MTPPWPFQIWSWIEARSDPYSQSLSVRFGAPTIWLPAPVGP